MSAAKSARNTRRKVTDVDVRRSLQGDAPAPFYLFHGEESYRRDALCRWALQQLRPEVAPDFNVDIFHGDSLQAERLLDTYASYPMMAPRRVVVLRDADRLQVPQAKALEPVVDDPSPTTVLVTVGAKLDMRRRLFAQMARQGMAVEFRVPYDDRLPEIIGEMAQERGLTLAPEAVDRLRLYVGTQLAEMANELDKLSIYLGERPGPVTGQDVQDVVGVSRETSVFDFTDAVGKGDRPLAASLLHALLDQGEEPHRILPLLTRHLQLLLRTQRLERRRVPRDEMARGLGISPFFLDSYRQQARSAPAAALWRGLAALRRADDLLKSGGGRVRHRAILDLCLSALTPPTTHPTRPAPAAARPG